mgnify:CR=1 FL=1
MRGSGLILAAFQLPNPTLVKMVSPQSGQRKGRGVKPRCVRKQGIGRMYIEIEICWIIRDATAREPAHICQLILKPRKLIQICQFWRVI